MRIMTTNIWGNYFNNPAELRLDDMYKVYETYTPDIIGFQEVEASWYQSNLLGRLSEKYNLIGTRLYDNCNYVPMAVKKEIKILANGFEYYADNMGDASKSLTWAVLDNDGKIFGVCNTHFWWKTGPEHDAAREIDAKQLCNLMKYIGERFSCPVFAFGDMNCNIKSSVFEKIYPENNIKCLYDLTSERDDVNSLHGDPERGADGKFHGKKTDKDHTYSIDHIVALGTGFDVLRYKVVEDQYALDASDHSPVYADIELE